MGLGSQQISCDKMQNNHIVFDACDSSGSAWGGGVSEIKLLGNYFANLSTSEAILP